MAAPNNGIQIEGDQKRVAELIISGVALFAILFNPKAHACDLSYPSRERFEIAIERAASYGKACMEYLEKNYGRVLPF